MYGIRNYVAAAMRKFLEYAPGNWDFGIFKIKISQDFLTQARFRDDFSCLGTAEAAEQQQQAHSPAYRLLLQQQQSVYFCMRLFHHLGIYGKNIRL